MKQPKFKFGDKVQVRALIPRPEHFFIVDDIWWDDDSKTYRYNDNWVEALLDECVEPKVKATYAYKYKYSNSGPYEIKYFDEDVGPRWGSWERDEDYDIHFTQGFKHV